MKYMILVSHGMFAPGLHDALMMLLGGEHEEIKSVSLRNGVSSEVFAKEVEETLDSIKEGSEIVVCGDLIGGSPLTTTINLMSQRGMLDKTVIIGGMNLPLVLTAALMKDSMDLQMIPDAALAEATGSLKQFVVETQEEDDI